MGILATKILATALMFSASGMTAVTAFSGNGRNDVGVYNDGNYGYIAYCQYVDADGDGVCDNYGIGGCGAGYVDADGDGICDNFNTGNPQNGNGFQGGRCGGGQGGQGRRGR